MATSTARRRLAESAGIDDPLAGGGTVRDKPWWPWTRFALNTSLLAGATVVVADGAIRARMNTGHMTDALRAQILSNSVNTAGALVWPVLFDFTVGIDKVIERPRLSMGFIWPELMAILDSYFVMQVAPTSTEEARGRSQALNMDAQAIISAAFAMGALLSGLKSAAGTHVIMFALIMSLALVIPSVSTPSHTQDHIIVQAFQRSALNYSMGYIITGISMDFLSGGASDPRMQTIRA